MRNIPNNLIFTIINNDNVMKLYEFYGHKNRSCEEHRLFPKTWVFYLN